MTGHSERQRSVDVVALFSRFEDILELLPDAAFVIDRDKRIVAWNRACEALTGVKQEALLGRGDHAYAEAFWGTACPMLVDLLDVPRPEAEARYKYVKRQGDVIFAEAFIPRLRGGRGAHLRGEAKALLDREGRRCGAIEVVRDVTEQKQMEQALRENEIKYRTLFENARDAILLMRRERFIDCNAVAPVLFGCSRERILASTPYALSPPVQPDGRSSEEKAFERIDRILKEGPETFEWVHCREDGTPFTAEVTLSRLELGGEVLIQAIVRDITGRKRTEEALMESERQLSLVLNNVSDVIFSIAVESGGVFRFSWVNRRFLEVTGLREGQIVGVPVREVIPEPAHALVFPRYEEAIRTGLPARWEEVSTYPGGKKVGQVTVVPVRDARGACTQLVGMVHDITQRKEAEEQISRLNEDLRREADALEQRVRTRTAQLAERNQELKDFAYTVSHDLKAPLRGIAGYANELDRKHRAGLSDRGSFCLRQILTATSHLDHLIEDLLQYSRLDSETPSLAEVDVRELVGAILRDRELVMSEQRVEVTVDIPPGRLRTWERGLVQVLSNLIDNAIKYTRGSSPPRLRIAAEVVEGAWRLSVADNGIGFDMKYHDRIFKLFNRLVRMEEYEGTGAGLAIAKKVLDKQHGRIWAESRPGHGAAFFVELPAPGDSQQEGRRS